MSLAHEYQPMILTWKGKPFESLSDEEAQEAQTFAEYLLAQNQRLPTGDLLEDVKEAHRLMTCPIERDLRIARKMAEIKRQMSEADQRKESLLKTIMRMVIALSCALIAIGGGIVFST